VKRFAAACLAAALSAAALAQTIAVRD